MVDGVRACIIIVVPRAGPWTRDEIHLEHVLPAPVRLVTR